MTNSSIVTRCNTVLDLVAGSASALTFTQIVVATGFPKSSVHRILAILVTEQLVIRDGERASYSRGPRLVRWATSLLNANDLPALATPLLERLSDRTEGNIALSILEGDRVLFLKTIHTGRPARMVPRVGEHSPAHACAAGKVLLAHLPERQFRSTLDALSLERYTEHTLTDRDQLIASLREIKREGYALCDREEFLQVVGQAVPVVNHEATATAAISVWNTIDREDITALQNALPDLLDCGRELSARLGYRNNEGP